MSLARTAALALLLPVLGTCAAVSINGTCVSGNCVTPAPTTYGNTEAGGTSNVITVNGDQFLLTSTFFAGTDSVSGGTFADFYPAATYIGTAPSGSTDTITIDLLASIAYGSPVDWSGTYNENIPLIVAANSTAAGQVLLSTTGAQQSVGLIGPYGPGSFDVSKSADLTSLIGSTLNYDFQYIFTFNAGTLPGATDSSPAPEPATFLLLGCSLLVIMLMRLRQ